MATSIIKNTKPIMKHQLFQMTTDATGNIVLGADWISRIITHIATDNTLVYWSIGVAQQNVRMIHFNNYDGSVLANTAVVVRIYWLDFDQFTTEEVTQ